MTDRRTFLGALGALSALPIAEAALAQGAPTAGQQARGWDLSWLDRLTARHKQVFDVGPINVPVSPLRIVSNYYAGFDQVLGLRAPDVQAVIGIAGSGYPINATDAAWARFRLGERYELRDPDTGQFATRNIYLERPAGHPEQDHTVRSLQRRGAIFWMCNNALTGLAQRFATEDRRPVAEVRAELVAELLPGVIIVPAHTMLLGLVQERGCTYEKL